MAIKEQQGGSFLLHLQVTICKKLKGHGSQYANTFASRHFDEHHVTDSIWQAAQQYIMGKQ